MIETKKEISTSLIQRVFKMAFEDSSLYSFICSDLKDEYLDTETERMFLHYMKAYKRENKVVPSNSTFTHYVEEKLSANGEKLDLFSNYVHGLEQIDVVQQDRQVLHDCFRKHITTRELYSTYCTFKVGATNGRGIIRASEDLHGSLSDILYKRSNGVSNRSIVDCMDDTLVQAQSRVVDGDKVRTGIDSYDGFKYATGGQRGGLKRGTSFLLIGRSGTGKSTFLRSLCYHAVAYGLDCVHIQAEGSDLDMKLAYSSMFSGIPLSHLSTGRFDKETVKKAIFERQEKIKGITGVERVGNIYSLTFEDFNKPSLYECKRFIEGIYNKARENPLSLIVVDYLDMFMDRSEDKLIQKKTIVAEDFTRTAVDYNCVVATATQAASVSHEFVNGVEGKLLPGVLSSHHISIDKQAINPFSYVASINQTEYENATEGIRFFEVKERHGQRSQLPVHKIHMNRTCGHFISNKLTGV